MVAALLHVTIAHDLQLLGGGADFTIIVIATLALLRGPEAGAAAGFVGGLFVDALTGQPLGYTSLVFAAVGYAIGSTPLAVNRRTPVRPLVVIAIAAAIARVGLAIAGFLLPDGAPLDAAFSLGTITTAAINLLLAIALYPLIRAALCAPLPASSPSSPSPPAKQSNDVPAVLA